MKKRKGFKFATMFLCLCLFASMSLGSGTSDSGDDKDIVSGDESSDTDSSSSKAVTIDQQVLVDQNGIVITAQEYVTDSFWGDGVSILIENNSDQNVTIGCTAMIVNNYMISDLFSEDVAAGKKANSTIYLSSSELEAAGIDTVGQLEIYFHVYESDTWDEIFDTGVVTIKTSAYDDMDTTPNDIGTELYNSGGIRIVGKTVDENSFWGAAILLYIENNSGRDIGISVENMSINGYMISALFSTSVYDGKMAIDDITIFSSDLEENGIDTIEDVELTFHIYDANTYSTIADSDTISFSAQ